MCVRMHTQTNKREKERRDSHLCTTEGTRLSTHLSISNIGGPLNSRLADVFCVYFSVYISVFIYLNQIYIVIEL